jgi:hypothetical protein
MGSDSGMCTSLQRFTLQGATCIGQPLQNRRSLEPLAGYKLAGYVALATLIAMATCEPIAERQRLHIGINYGFGEPYLWRVTVRAAIYRNYRQICARSVQLMRTPISTDKALVSTDKHR